MSCGDYHLECGHTCPCPATDSRGEAVTAWCDTCNAPRKVTGFTSQIFKFKSGDLFQFERGDTE